jgi:hypothetical protein
VKKIETGDAYEFDRKSEEELRELVAEQDMIRRHSLRHPARPSTDLVGSGVEL